MERDSESSSSLIFQHVFLARLAGELSAFNNYLKQNQKKVLVL